MGGNQFVLKAAATILMLLLIIPHAAAFETRPYCRSAPIIIVSPLVHAVKSGTVVTYNISVYNNNARDVCGSESYTVSATLPANINQVTLKERLSVSMGNQQWHNTTLTLWSNSSAPVGNYTITLKTALSGDSEVLNQTTIRYAVTETTSPLPDLAISKLEWHCESAAKEFHGKYCRKEDIFHVDALEIINYGSAFSGKVSIVASTSELRGSSIYDLDEKGSRIGRDNAVPMELKFPVKITSPKFAEVRLNISSSPSDTAANNEVVISITVTEKEGCQYHFPVCQEGLVCRRNKCVENSTASTPTPQPRGEKISGGGVALPKTNNVMPEAVQAGLLTDGSACIYNSECATGACRRRTCMERPSGIAEETAGAALDIMWGVEHLLENFFSGQ